MTLSYYRHGTGNIGVIAAHSWVASPVAFAPILAGLDTDRYSWVFPSFAGYGEDAAAVDHIDIGTMGHDLVAVADDLGWSAFHLVGRSMGGQAAQAVVADVNVAPRVTSLTLVSPVPAAGFPVDDGTRAFFEGAAADPALMFQVNHMLASGGEDDRLLADYITTLSRATTRPDALAAYLRAWTQDDVSAGVDQYAGPVLVVSGEHDPALGPAVATTVAETFRRARTEVIEGSGHFPPLERPAVLARLISEHISTAQHESELAMAAK